MGNLTGGISVGNAESPSGSFNRVVASFTVPNPVRVYGPSHGLAERTYSNRPISRCYRYGPFATISNVVGPITVGRQVAYLVTDTVMLTGRWWHGCECRYWRGECDRGELPPSPCEPWRWLYICPTVSFISATEPGASATAAYNIGESYDHGYQPGQLLYLRSHGYLHWW